MSFRNEFIVKPGGKVRLADRDPGNTLDYLSKEKARAELRKQVQRLAELQYLLYAENRRAVLIVLQAMDAGGKDGAIRHVMSGLNPQSCRVTSFKQPTAEELGHDFLWRIHRATPRKGEIGIFNRSHYEDVLVVRVRDLAPKAVWSKRYEAINQFERVLADEGTVVLKFFLHISKEEQLERFRDRLSDPTKHWKVSPGDFEERKRWPAYMKAFEDALSKCSTGHAPWFVIPANRKWFRDLAIIRIIIEALEGLDMKFPKPQYDLSKIVVE